MHAEKAMELTYSSIEDRNIALLRERIQSETQTGYNFFYFAGCMCRFVRSIVQIISSVSLTFSFFMVDSVSLWAKLALIGGIAVTTIISMFTTKKSSQLMNEFFSILTQAALKSPEERLKKLPLQEHSIKMRRLLSLTNLLRLSTRFQNMRFTANLMIYPSAKPQYISHRLASCRFCDEILVFDAGCIVQHGTHEVLLAQTGGKYSELWNAQAQYYVKQA